MEYQKLIIKFLVEEISDTEMILLKSWLKKDPENRLIFDKVNELWQETTIHTKLENFKTDLIWDNISSQLGIGKNKNKSIIVISKNKYWIIIAAASVAFLMALGGLTLWISEKSIFSANSYRINNFFN